jgi:RES domain
LPQEEEDLSTGCAPGNSLYDPATKLTRELPPVMESRGTRHSFSLHGATSGHRIVYFAESRAGALIEALVHTELNERTWPRVYDLMRVAAPDGIQLETVNVLAKEDWQRFPIFTRSLGDEWLHSQRTALARVPSAIFCSTPNTQRRLRSESSKRRERNLIPVSLLVEIPKDI